ncbi:hypothetical protein BDV11DRAFT_180702 [Aspergillus similis]
MHPPMPLPHIRRLRIRLSHPLTQTHHGQVFELQFLLPTHALSSAFLVPYIIYWGLSMPHCHRPASCADHQH